MKIYRSKFIHFILCPEEENVSGFRFHSLLMYQILPTCQVLECVIILPLYVNLAYKFHPFISDPEEWKVSVFQFPPLLMCQALPDAKFQHSSSLYFHYVLIKPITFWPSFYVLKKESFRFFDFSL